MAAPEPACTAADMAGRAVVVKVDTERYPQLAARYNVRGIPNFAVFNGGRLVAQQAGLVDHAKWKTGCSPPLPSQRRNPVEAETRSSAQRALRSVRQRQRVAR